MLLISLFFELGCLQVGYPNVGKSSSINTLLNDKKVPVSATPGRTKHFQVRDTFEMNKDDESKNDVHTCLPSSCARVNFMHCRLHRLSRDQLVKTSTWTSQNFVICYNIITYYTLCKAVNQQVMRIT